VVLRGAPVLSLWPEILALLVFGVVVMTLAVRRTTKSLD
jgi:ABC-2 type transport system permease protein